jgi:hypothetical protein
MNHDLYEPQIWYGAQLAHTLRPESHDVKHARLYILHGLLAAFFMSDHVYRGDKKHFDSAALSVNSVWDSGILFCFALSPLS